MSILLRIMDEVSRRVFVDLQEEQAVRAGFLREPPQPRPEGIGTSNYTIAPHPSAAPYPYIVDAGIDHNHCTPDGPCKCYPNGNWDPGQ